LPRLFSIIAALTLLLLSACSESDREVEVNRLIQQAVALAEDQNLSGLMELTQDGFTAGPGDRSSKEVRRILFVIFKRFGKFRIHYPKPSIKLSEDENSAIVKMNFLMASNGKMFPELKILYEDTAAWFESVDRRADIYTLTMELGYASGEWLVEKARITTFSSPHGNL
jgi:hypothetical protein